MNLIRSRRPYGALPFSPIALMIYIIVYITVCIQMADSDLLIYWALAFTIGIIIAAVLEFVQGVSMRAGLAIELAKEYRIVRSMYNKEEEYALEGRIKFPIGWGKWVVLDRDSTEEFAMKTFNAYVNDNRGAIRELQVRRGVGMLSGKVVVKNYQAKINAVLGEGEMDREPK